MNYKELHDLIQKGDKEFLKIYLDNLKAKLENINSLNDKLSALLILIVVTYFLIKNSLISNVNLGLIELNNFEIGLIAIPLIFSFLLLYYAILNAHRSEVYRASKIISHYLIKGEILNPDQELYPNDLVRQFLPFSMWEDIMRMNYHGTKYGCLPALMTIPLLGIIILPIWFQYYSIEHLIIDHWNKGIYVQIVVILTIWIIFYTLFFYYKLFKINLKREKQ